MPRSRPRLHRPQRLALVLGCLAWLGGACTSEGIRTGVGTAASGTPRFALAASLRNFDACDGLLAHLKAEATDRVTAFGLAGVGGMFAEALAGDVRADVAAATPATATATATDAAAATGKVAGVDYSMTNTVEAGIDEGDRVKTDGTNLFLANGNRFVVVSATGPDPKEIGSLSLAGTATQLVRVGTTVLLAGQPEVGTAGTSDPAGTSADVLPAGFDSRSVLWQVDISDPAAPVLKRQLVLDGSVLSIRMTGDVARIVVRTPPAGLDFVAPNSPGSEARALRTNKGVIADSTIEDWLGGYQLLDGNGKQLGEGLLAPCPEVSIPPSFHGFDTTTVLSVALSRGLAEPDGATVLADSQRVYASAEHLYVAIGSWQDPGGPVAATNVLPPVDGGGDATTAIHRFTFDGDRATYSATGTVTGSLMNDFSMSELDGVLRVATTAGPPWGTSTTSESFVTTLRARDSELATLGRVGDLGKGERIYGVRFVGTNGYVVTFRQTDPLYVVDLRDPAAPAVTGELKMNGYSGYLHPIGPDRLLGVGRDADATGRTTGALVSVFDVSDPTAPVRTASYTLPDAWLNTEWDHQSFLWWEPERLALMTGSVTSASGAMLGGVLGLDVGPTTITERGRIVPDEMTQCVQPTNGDSRVAAPCWIGAAPIERTVIVGPRLFAISTAAVSAHDLRTLAAQGELQLN